MSTTPTLLQVKDLDVQFQTNDGLVYAVRLAAGDTADRTAERLVEKLSVHREVALIESSELRAILRILR